MLQQMRHPGKLGPNLALMQPENGDYEFANAPDATVGNVNI
jgi:hypothetical protein